MTVPWIENREIKYEHKTNKYKMVQTNLRLDYPGYEIDQVTLVMDVLGGGGGGGAQLKSCGQHHKNIR